MPKVDLDHPYIRASYKCLFCESPKQPGLLSCWPCFRSFKVMSQDFEYALDREEQRLTRQLERADRAIEG